MKNETHDDRVKILSDWKEYPEANTIDSDGDFWNIPDVGENLCLSNSSRIDYDVKYSVGLRSLTDIQKQVDMQNEINRLDLANERLSRSPHEHRLSLLEIDELKGAIKEMQNEIDALKIENSKLSHRIYEHNCRIIGAPR